MSTPRSRSPTPPSSACRAPASPRRSRPRSRSCASCASARSGSTTPAASGSTAIPSAASARAASGAKACATPWRSSRSGSSPACGSIRNDRGRPHRLRGHGAGRGGDAADDPGQRRVDRRRARPRRPRRRGAHQTCRDRYRGSTRRSHRPRPGAGRRGSGPSRRRRARRGRAARRGRGDCLIISVGALADPALLARLKDAAHAGESRILLPAGAIGGLDAIAAMRVAGLTSVRYRSRKPPAAWRGTPAERQIDLGALTQPTVLYKGIAGEAALLYPQNANVAAAVALAGLGFDATEVELVADPGAPGNVHEIEAEGAAGRFAIQLQGKPSRTNPKTSALAAMSVARALLNRQATIVI